MLFFAAGILLSLLKEPYQQLRLRYYSRRTIYLFSECNRKTIAIARSITCSDKYKVVFASFGRQNECYINDIETLGAIIINEQVEVVLRRIKKKSKHVEVFLFSYDEELNLHQLGQLPLADDAKALVRVYVEVHKTPWSLYDGFINELTSCNEKLTINLVRTEENFIYNELINNSIFENALSCHNIKVINILIVGYNYRNIELLKAVLHLGQMPGYELNVTLIESEDHKSELGHLLPEIKECGEGFGDSVYSFKYLTRVMFNTVEFDNCIRSECSDFTYAFVNAGDDLFNMDIALQMYTSIYRCGNYYNRKILVNRLDKTICNKDMWNSDHFKNVSFVGSISEVYDYSFITMSTIELASRAIHDIRQREKAIHDKSYIIQSWPNYCNNEYNRHSVYARTLSCIFKVKLINEDDDSAICDVINTNDEWRIYEHMRWNVYTRTLGYVRAPEVLLDSKREVKKDIRTVAKVHHCLVSFDELSPEEKRKDSLTLTPEIVSILKKF